MGNQFETFTGTKRISKSQFRRVTIDRLRQQGLICKTHLDPARESGNGRVCAFDAAVTADGLNSVQIVGIGDLGRNHVAKRHTAPRD